MPGRLVYLDNGCPHGPEQGKTHVRGSAIQVTSSACASSAGELTLIGTWSFSQTSSPRWLLGQGSTILRGSSLGDPRARGLGIHQRLCDGRAARCLLLGVESDLEFARLDIVVIHNVFGSLPMSHAMHDPCRAMVLYLLLI